MEHTIEIHRKTSKFSPVGIIKKPLPHKGIIGITREVSKPYAKTESYYFEDGKFYAMKVMGNMAYNKQFPKRKPIVGVDDEYSIREI